MFSGLLLLVTVLLYVCNGGDPIAYRIQAGSEITINNMISNYTYYTTGETASSPSNITLTTRNGAVMIPIVYTEVYYLLYNATTNETDTLYIALCDPIPNRDPGNLTLSELGVTICPTHYDCIVTDLRPDYQYQNWPDLRSCLLNYTITDRTDLPALASGTTVEAQVMNMDAVLDAPVPDIIVTFGIVDCNDFIARSLNCQWTRQLNTYQTQCLDSPVPCYSRGIGKWFGAFFEQNPLYSYTLPRAQWTEKHYQGLASTMNYMVYYKDGQLVDPLTSLVLDDYYWIPDLLDLAQSSSTFIASAYPLPDFIQALGRNWVSGWEPSPPTEIKAFDSATFVACVFSFDQTCADVDWYNETSVVMRYPGVVLALPLTSEFLIYSVRVEVPFTIYGIEVYDGDGNSCGKYMQELSAGQNVTFQCLQSVPSNGTLMVIFHYQGTIVDIVGKGLAPGIEPYFTALNALLDYQGYGLNSYVALLWGYIITTVAAGVQLLDAIKLLPNRIDPNFLYIGTQSAPSVTVNFTSVTDNAQFAARISEISANIRQNNSYPWNYALSNWTVVQEYTTLPFDYNNPDHRDYMYQQWSTWYSPRQAGSEAGQCQTFNLGETVYPILGPKQFWFNGDEQPGYDIPQGTLEGGCLCNNTLNFLQAKFFCSRCVEGYGPETLTAWADVLQSNRLIAQVLPVEYPFTYTAYTEEEFQELFMCKFPMSPDPITGSLAAENICSGHGLLGVTTTTTQFNQTQIWLNNYWVFPLCQEILLADTVYTMVQTQDPLSQQFLSTEDDIITIINNAFYVNGEACLFTAEQSMPPYGSLSCGDSSVSPVTLACINEDLFISNGTTFDQGRVASFNTWLGYFL